MRLVSVSFPNWSPFYRQRCGLILAMAAFIAFLFFVSELYTRPRVSRPTEMSVILPRFVQVLMTCGDRYLAANLAGFRALVSTPETMTVENFHVLGIVQSDVAWLNPAHEDNYYIAAAILPWYGEVSASQRILMRASNARPFDVQPPFFLAFNELHFYGKPAEGAKWLLVASQRASDEIDQIGFQQLAALWVAKGEDAEFAIRMHHSMARSTQDKGFAQFLDKRAARLQNVLDLNRAIRRCKDQAGHLLTHLNELVILACINEIPIDPFGGAYYLDLQGTVRVAEANSNRLPVVEAVKGKQ